MAFISITVRGADVAEISVPDEVVEEILGSGEKTTHQNEDGLSIRFGRAQARCPEPLSITIQKDT